MLDRNCVGRIGDFGICKSATDTGSVTATHIQTQNVVGTLLYMSSEYLHGDLSPKVDTFACGLVVLEALTGYSIYTPAPGYSNLLLLFEEKIDSVESMLRHLDRRARWDTHTPHRVAAFHSIATRCLESRRTFRPEILELIPELEKVRQDLEVSALMPPEVEDSECCVCMEANKTHILIPCAHLCVCEKCADAISINKRMPGVSRCHPESLQGLSVKIQASRL